MKLLSVRIQNFCQHTQRQDEFEGGLLGVLGANGSGKSNWMGACSFALTGRNPNNGVLLENISQYADDNDKSAVTLQFSHKDITAEVRRSLRPSSCRLSVDGEEPVRGAKAVNERILDILGVDEDLLHTVAFVYQDDIFGFLAKTPAKRLDAFSRLFRLDAAQDLHNFLTGKIHTILVPEVAADLDELRKRRGEQEQRVAQLQQELQTLPNPQEISSGIEECDATLNRFQRYLEANQGKCTAREALMQALAARKAAEAVRDEAHQDAETLHTAAKGQQEAAERAKGLLANLAAYQRTEAARQQLQTKLENAKAAAAQATSPVPTPVDCDPTQVDAYTEELQRTVTQLARSRSFVQSFADGRAICPTCGTSAEVGTTLAANLESARQEVPELEAQATRLQAWITASKNYAEAQQKRQQVLDWQNRTIEQLNEQLAQLDDIPPVTESAENLQSTVNHYTEFLKGAKAYEEAHQNAVRQVAVLEERVTQAESQLQHYTQQADTYETSQEDADAARQRRATLVTQQGRVYTIQGDLRHAEGAIDQLARHITQAEASAAEAVAARSWRERIQAVRDIVHRDAAPRFCIQQTITNLEGTVNEYLSEFGADFRVTATDGITFEARFLDGVRVQPAERLSEGQKVVLALSFRLAVNFTYAGDLAFLALDEPTRNLDRERIQNFAPVLNKLRSMAASRGMQCVLITHEEQLEPLFDHTIRL